MDARESEIAAVKTVSKLWWLWLVVGVLWVMISIVILQFDAASATTVGIIVGVMILFAGLQYIAVGTQAEGWSWLWYVFGAFLILGGVIALVYPVRSFLSIANILGFLFAFIGIIWIIEAFLTKDGNELWWLNLVAGILMVVLGFWLGGQFFFAKAETLLVFAGIWALMRGIIDVITAFQVKKLGSIGVDS